MVNKKCFAVILGLVFSCSSLAYSNTFKQLAEIPVEGHPESIVRFDKSIYVSNLGTELAPLEKDGDGFISRYDLNGKQLTLKLFTGLNSPKGMALVKNILYVTDIDRVVGFNLSTRKKVFELNIVGSVYLNDITVKGTRTLFVSDTTQGKIHQINLSDQTYSTLEVSVEGVNGLHYDAKVNELHVVSNLLDTEKQAPVGLIGKIKWVDDTPVYSAISKQSGGYDGVGMFGRELYVSDWSTQGVYHVSTLGRLKPVVKDINGPADFYLDSRTNRMYLPDLTQGKIYIFRK